MFPGFDSGSGKGGTDPGGFLKLNGSIVQRIREVAEIVATELQVSADEVVRAVGLPGLAVGREEGLDRLLVLNSALCREAAGEVSRALSDAGVPHFFAKGVALLETGVYSDGDRTLSDVDVYVPFDSFESGIEALTEDVFFQLMDSQQSGPASLRSAVTLEREGAGSIDNVHVDCHRGLDPLERLLPRPDRRFDECAWQAVDEKFAVPVPGAPVHCLILLHQLVHNDLLQFHTLADLALIWNSLSESDTRALQRMAVEFKMGGFLLDVAGFMEREFGLTNVFSKRALSGSPALELVDLLRNSFSATMSERAMITTGRIKTRQSLLDGSVTATLIADSLFPPPDFLRWRWRSPLPVAYSMHALQVVRKVMKL